MGAVRTGLDLIVGERRSLLRNYRVGLVTNAAAITRQVVPAVEAVRSVCNLVALFSPEHGLSAHEADGQRVLSKTDPRTGLPIHSLYGEHKKPTASMLADVDLVLLDLPDVGARFYTYVWTMSYVLEAAAEHGRPLVVLDRPNPIGGHICEGPLLDPAYASFVGRHSIPVRHGLTIGELAHMLNDERGLDANLTVVSVAGWQRTMWFDQTGLPWAPPSPAMPTPDTALVYPGTCLLEGTNVSEGRGTTTPFKCLGAPWVDGHRLAAALNERELPGVRFRPVTFVPCASKYQGQTCEGVYLHVTDREVFRPLRVGLHIIAAIRAFWPDKFSWLGTSWEGRPPHFDLLIGNDWVRQEIDAGVPVSEIINRWQGTLSSFLLRRKRYLIYPPGPRR